MITLYFSRFIKTIMMTTPFLTLIIMLLALWGVVGKATYADLEIAKSESAVSGVKAKNFLVSETTNKNECNAESTNADLQGAGNKKGEALSKKLPQRIDWSRVI
jgi:hypothetical protein